MKHQFQESTNDHIYAASEVVHGHWPGWHKGSELGGSRGSGITRYRGVRDGTAAKEADRADRRLRVQRLVYCLTMNLKEFIASISQVFPIDHRILPCQGSGSNEENEHCIHKCFVPMQCTRRCKFDPTTPFMLVEANSSVFILIFAFAPDPLCLIPGENFSYKFCTL